MKYLSVWDVAKGQVCAPYLAPTRTGTDFAQHIEQVIKRDPDGGWILVVNQLNTHQSETLVRLVARECQLSEDLGIKGKSGIL